MNLVAAPGRAAESVAFLLFLPLWDALS
jgi:hypothetical protein